MSLSRLAESGGRAVAARRVRRYAPMFGSAAALYGAGVALLPASVGVAIFGEIWRDARELVPFVAAGEVFRVTTFPLMDVMKVYGAPTVLVRTRVVTSATVVLGMLAGGAVDGARGAVIGYAVAAVVNAMLWRARVRQTLAQPEREAL